MAFDGFVLGLVLSAPLDLHWPFVALGHRFMARRFFASPHQIAAVLRMFVSQLDFKAQKIGCVSTRLARTG